MSDFTPVATLDELPEGTAKQVVVKGDLVGLYRAGAEVWAIHDICTHEEAYLTEGEFDTDDLEVECPLHGSRFDLRSGNVRILPATRPVATYEVKIDGDLVLVGPRTDPR